MVAPCDACLSSKAHRHPNLVPFHGTKLLPLPFPPFGLLSVGRGLQASILSRTCGDFAGSGFLTWLFFGSDFLGSSFRSGLLTLIGVTSPTVRLLARLTTTSAGFGVDVGGGVVPVIGPDGTEGVGRDMSTARPGLEPLSVLIDKGVPSLVWL